MAKDRHPSTAAVRALREHGVAFVPHVFEYVARGGTAHSAQVLGVDEHHVIKTLIFEDEHKKPLCVLMHGDREVSTKSAARVLGVKSVRPCTPDSAQRHSGYLVGGTSPFGLRHVMPILAEDTIFALERIYINGGARGFLVEIAPAALAAALSLQRVSVAA